MKPTPRPDVFAALRRHHREVLPNGLRCHYIPMPHLNSAVVAVNVRAGGSVEGRGEAGLSHFVEHLLFKGTPTYPNSRALAAAIEDLGGETNGHNGFETVSYYVRIHRDHLRRALAVFGEMFAAPLLRDEDIEFEKNVVIQELFGSGAEEGVGPIEAWVWPGRDSGMGSEKAIRAYKPGQIHRFFRDYYVAENMVVSVAGGFDLEITRRAIADTFGGLRRGPTPPSPRMPRPRRGPGVGFRPLPGKMADVSLAFLTCSYRDPRHVALSVLDTILGEGTASRLFTRVRERLGLVYEIGSNTLLYRDRGLLEVSFSARTKHVAKVTAEVIKELRLLRKEGVTAEEVRHARERLRCTHEAAFDDPMHTAFWFATQEILLGGGHARKPERFLDRLARIDAAAVNDLVAETIRPARQYVAVYAPAGSCNRWRKTRWFQKRSVL